MPSIYLFLPTASIISETSSSLQHSLDFKCSGLEYIPNSCLQKMTRNNSRDTMSDLNIPSEQLSEYNLNMPLTTINHMIEAAVMPGIPSDIDSTEEIDWTNSRPLQHSIDVTSHKDSLSSVCSQKDIQMDPDRAIRISLPYDTSARRTELCCLLEPKARLKVHVQFDVDSCLESLSSYVVHDFVFFKHQGVELEVRNNNIKKY